VKRVAPPRAEYLLLSLSAGNVDRITHHRPLNSRVTSNVYISSLENDEMIEIEDIRISAIFRSRALHKSRSRSSNRPNQFSYPSIIDSIRKNALVL